MKITFVVLVSLLALAAFADAKTKWHQLEGYTFEKYIKEYRKIYSPEEYNQRKSLFEARLNEIRKHNQDPTKSWKQGVNHMTDLSNEEFKTLLGYKKGLAYASKNKRVNQMSVMKDVSIEGLPTHVDWREKGVVSDVKDQGRCGSCWSFATAETVESHWAKATGHLTDLSQQQILDCTPNPKHCGGTGGCSGGTAELAFERIIAMGGLSTEWTYSYNSYFGSNFACKFNATQTRPFATLSNYVVLPSNKYEPILQAVANVGPLAISVDASTWSHYESGVYNGCDQEHPDIDHAVQLVGYGEDPVHGAYWLVRNSWSPAWGENGYIRLARTSTVQCGIDTTPSDGSGCDGGPPTVTVCGTCGILYDVSYPIVSA